MKTKAINIRETVFDNETEAILYVTKDNEVEPSLYVFALPIIAFSWSAENDKELEYFFPMDLFKDKERVHKLLEQMKAAMNDFD